MTRDHNRRIRSSVLATLATATLILSACGSSSDSSDGSSDTSTDTAAVSDTVAQETVAPETAAATETTPAATETSAAAATETTFAAAAEPAAAADGSTDGEWKITSGSEAGYRVPEILQGQETEGVGRTKALTGSMTIAGTQATAGTFEFDLTGLASDSSRRDGQVRDRILKTTEFPKATFVLTGPVDFGNIPADKEEVTAKATGDLTLLSTTKPVTVDLTARRNGANVEVLGSLEITFADWGIEDPSVKPFVEVGKTGFIEWLLVMAK
jgi:polyisoprenoid-binding protein YceI